MRLISRYILFRYLRLFALISTLVLALILLFDFVGMNNFFAARNPSTWSVLRFVMWNMPEAFTQLLPLIILLTSMFTFLSLAQRSELVVMRAIGIPIIRGVVNAVLLSAAIGLASASFANPPLVSSRIIAQEIKDQIQGRKRAIIQVAGNGIWLREEFDDEARIIHIAGVNLARERADGVEIFVQNATQSRRVITAQSAKIDENGDWLLTDVDETRFSIPIEKQHYDQLTLPANQSFAELFEPLNEPRQISNFAMPAHLRALDRDGYNTRPARAYFYRSLASPLGFGAMCLVGALFALAPFRGSNVILRLLMALGAGFVLFAIDSFVSSLGRANYLPLWFASIATPILAFVLGYLALVTQEDG